ncbi:MAG: permease prefix domain 1-containing protein [Terracidiphilus sp.]
MTSWILRTDSKLGELFRQTESNREFSDEVETHIELLTARFVDQGMTQEEAAWAARRQFGNAALLEQRHREARAWLWVTTVFKDIRYAMRMLAKSPGVTAIAIESLALGIGATTAIFTVAKSALFDALAVPHPEQL